MNAVSALPSPLTTSLPRWIFLQLLENCNLRCRMCYEWGDSGPYRHKKTLHRLDIDVVKRIIDECTPVTPYYELYGGEPLLYPEIEEVLFAIQRAGSKVHLPTNGTLLEKHAELLVEASTDRIWVSLDGPPDINDNQRGSGVFARAVRGIQALHAARGRKGVSLPHIGISTVITPLNYRHLESFFFEALDIGLLDCISLELQAYLTERDHQDYEKVLQTEFNVDGAPISKGFVTAPSSFAGMEFGVIASQVAKIAAYCQQNGVYLNTYPKVMSEDNIRKYFSADWFSMSGVKTRCSFPWVSTEVSARGDVTSCHAFYDLTLGNVNQRNIGEIWRGEAYERYRRYLRKHLFPICQACCLFYNEKPPILERQTSRVVINATQ
jgi:radical SAM protein with 4Fe4S-binding SPASM domain